MFLLEETLLRMNLSYLLEPIRQGHRPVIYAGVRQRDSKAQQTRVGNLPCMAGQTTRRGSDRRKPECTMVGVPNELLWLRLLLVK